MRLKSLFNIESVLVVFFSASLALGTFNPFVMSDSEEGGIGLGQVMTVLLLPFLYKKYRGRVKRILVFNNWIVPLIIFYTLMVFTSFVQAQVTPISFYLYWAKLLIAITLCILLPVSLSDERLLNMSVLAFSLASVTIAVAVLSGLMSNYIWVNNGRLLLWGENPNSSSTRWAVAIMFLVYQILKNPFNFGKWRFVLMMGILPLIMLIFMSGSRGSLIITILCLFVYFLRSSGKNIIKPIVYIALVAIPLAIIAPRYINFEDYAMMARLQSSIDEGGNEIREQLLRGALTIFSENILFGVGNTNFMNIMTQRFHFENTVHNLYAFILAISGLCGAIPFFVFMWRLIKGCWDVKYIDLFPGVLLFFMCFIASKTGGILCYLLMWYIYALVISYVNIAKNKFL